MKDARLVRIGQPGPSRLEIVREFPKERITVTFRIAAQKESLVWNVKVENNHPECDVIEVEAPVLSGLRLSGDPARDLLIWPFSVGISLIA